VRQDEFGAGGVNFYLFYVIPDGVDYAGGGDIEEFASLYAFDAAALADGDTVVFRFCNTGAYPDTPLAEAAIDGAYTRTAAQNRAIVFFVCAAGAAVTAAAGGAVAYILIVRRKGGASR
jgi:hypothetical protein